MSRDAISFAQNAEDVVLWRLFRNRSSPGFFIDVGAAHPIVDSVTKWFSINGWTGVNVEPVPHLFAELTTDRPDEVNLQVVCSKEAGTARMVVADMSKWGQSSIDPSTSAALVDAGLSHATIEVEAVTLASIFETYAPPTGVDFLKIDAEGSEDVVLAGAGLEVHRPRVIVVEAVEPDSDIQNHERWEHHLHAANYTCALFDGLSRFYCQADDAEACRVLGIPAYYGDHFITMREFSLRMALENVKLIVDRCLSEVRSVRGSSQPNQSIDEPS